MSTHAVLSPSSASRWMTCPGAPVLEAGEPDSESKYAYEGTIAHTVAAHCLEKKIDTKGILFIDVPQRDGKMKTEIVPMDMREYIQGYLDYVRERIGGGELLIEQGLELDWLTGEKNATGTSDVVIISKDGSKLKIIDLKYGYRRVPAKDNPQVGIYGLSAVRQYDLIGEFKSVEGHIYQPRCDNIDDDEISIEDLNAFEAKVRAAVKRVEEARKSNSLDGFLNPSPKACEYCKAAHKCPALAGQLVEATLVDFEDETQTQLAEPVDLVKAADKIEMIEGWIKAVRSKLEKTLLSGGRVKGWKLVEGKKGHRAWLDEEAVAKKMVKLGVSKKDIYDNSVRSPAQLEKLVKKNEKALAAIPSLLAKQKPGSPSVARISDKRTEYHANPQEDFDDVTD